MNSQEKKFCRFCVDREKIIDYKNTNLLKRLISSYAKIAAKRRSGTCSFHQRQVAKAIKRARFMALLPYTNK